MWGDQSVVRLPDGSMVVAQQGSEPLRPWPDRINERLAELERRVEELERELRERARRDDGEL